MKSLIALIALITPFSLHAIETDKAAHFGVSYVINTSVYAGCLAAAEDSKLLCSVVSATSTAAIGAAKEFVDGNKNTNRQHAEDMGANLLGIGASLLTVRIAF